MIVTYIKLSKTVELVKKEKSEAIYSQYLITRWYGRIFMIVWVGSPLSIYLYYKFDDQEETMSNRIFVMGLHLHNLNVKFNGSDTVHYMETEKRADSIGMRKYSC